MFLITYLPYIFFHAFNAGQLEIIDSIVARIKRGGWQAVASPRGSGKSTIVRGLCVWAIVTGRIKYAVLLNANASTARDALADIKAMIEKSDLLCEDFPEICVPIRELEGAVQRCRTQLYEGKLTRLQWAGDVIVFPTIGRRGKAAGAIIRSIGVDGAIRGMLHEGKRPDLVLADDIETRESASSYLQTGQRRKIVENDVVGLAGKGKPIAIFMLGTIIRKGSLCDEFTDRKTKPSWYGVRQKLLAELPTNDQLWTKYVELRQRNQIDGDQTGRAAHQFYLDNITAMQQGAVVTDPNRFNLESEIDALEHVYNLIADIGWDNFSAEYQNEPPTDETAEISGLNVSVICKKLSSLDRGVFPSWAKCLTCGIDVGGRQLHYVVVGWGDGARGSVIDYGTEIVHSPVSGRLTDEHNKEALEQAILSALIKFRDMQAEGCYAIELTGEVKNLDGCLIDSGWQTDPIYSFVRSSADRIYKPAKGWGSGGSKYRQPQGQRSGIKLGSHFYQSFQSQSKIWLTNIDTDYFKRQIQNAFLTPEDQPGSVSLFGTNPITHQPFARHLMSEIWTREFIPGKGMKEFFDLRSKLNHYLDAAALALAVAAMMGITVLQTRPPETQRKQQRQVVHNGSSIRTRY